MSNIDIVDASFHIFLIIAIIEFNRHVEGNIKFPVFVKPLAFLQYFVDSDVVINVVHRAGFFAGEVDTSIFFRLVSAFVETLANNSNLVADFTFFRVESDESSLGSRRYGYHQQGQDNGYTKYLQNFCVFHFVPPPNKV